MSDVAVPCDLAWSLVLTLHTAPKGHACWQAGPGRALAPAVLPLPLELAL